MAKIINSILPAVIVLAMPNFGVGSRAAAAEKAGNPQYNEYDVKAAFLYNFIKFAEWPADKLAEPNTLAIGILGENPFGKAFENIKGKTVQNRKVVIKQFGKFSELCKDTAKDKTKYCANAQSLRQCHLLFICKSEQPYFEQIMGTISEAGVLTVGENEGFLEAGGIINFVPNAEKAVFEINLTVAKKEKIRISSQVLRLARRVIGAETGRQFETESLFARLVCLKEQ